MSKTKWYQKPIYLLVALALVLSLGIIALPMAGTVAAAVINVPADYPTIKQAVDNATAGDTINVAAGTYYENDITLKDGVEILGAGADVTTIDGGGNGWVVKGSGVGSTTKLDGFTITNGNALDGGGIRLCNSFPVISNCIFSGNSATSYGGGMYNYNNSSPTVTNCTFDGNSAGSKGGGIYNRNCSPTVTNCIFSGNSATSYDGGGMYNYNSTGTVRNCVFTGNSADYHGGGMGNYQSSPTVTNCVFTGNSATNYGGGIYNYQSSPTVTNCVFSDNSGYYGGGMYNSNSTGTVRNCIFSGNSATRFGGGMGNSVGSSPQVTGCTFKGNSAGLGGGGMYNLDSASPNVTNCVFEDNSASLGGGMYNVRSSPTVTNCIFEGNSAVTYGGGVYNTQSSPTVTNCILANNSAGSSGGGIYATYFSSPTIDYNDVWDNSPNDYYGCSAGPHDISQDPMFVNPATHDFHSKPGSPCIDAGTNKGAPSEDMEGNPRPVDGYGDGWAITDMGAYEYVRPTPPAHLRYLHSTSGWFNLTDPVGTQWHELWPFFCKEYHLSSWEDNGDGVLSRCDRIDMYQKPDGEVRWYHVENVTITLNVTHNETGGPMYIELEGGYNASVLNNPLDTQWHQIYPILCRQYELISWNDTGGDGLGYCDYIELTDKWTGEKTRWHVEEVAIDIIVTIEPPPVGGEAYPVNKFAVLAPWIALAVLLAGGTGWLALRRRRA